MLNYKLTCIYEKYKASSRCRQRDDIRIRLKVQHSKQVYLLSRLPLFLYTPIVSPESNSHFPR